jgi:hypothetical protein
MHGARLAVERALARGVEEVRLELDRGEVLRVFGQVRDAAVARERVGEGDDGAGVQVAVGREHLAAQEHLALHQALGDLGEGHADQPRKEVPAEAVEAVGVEPGAQRHELLPVRCEKA